MTDPLDRPSGTEALVVRSQRLGRETTNAARDLELVVMGAYEVHHRDLLSFARALVGDPEAAEDLVADAFLRLIGEVRAGLAPTETRAWLYRVVANLVVRRHSPAHPWARRSRVTSTCQARVEPARCDFGSTAPCWWWRPIPHSFNRRAAA